MKCAVVSALATKTLRDDCAYSAMWMYACVVYMSALRCIKYVLVCVDRVRQIWALDWRCLVTIWHRKPVARKTPYCQFGGTLSRLCRGDFIKYSLYFTIAAYPTMVSADNRKRCRICAFNAELGHCTVMPFSIIWKVMYMQKSQLRRSRCLQSISNGLQHVVLIILFRNPQRLSTWFKIFERMATNMTRLASWFQREYKEYTSCKWLCAQRTQTRSRMLVDPEPLSL